MRDRSWEQLSGPESDAATTYDAMHRVYQAFVSSQGDVMTAAALQAGKRALPIVDVGMP